MCVYVQVAYGIDCTCTRFPYDEDAMTLMDYRTDYFGDPVEEVGSGKARLELCCITTHNTHLILQTSLYRSSSARCLAGTCWKIVNSVRMADARGSAYDGVHFMCIFMCTCRRRRRASRLSCTPCPWDETTRATARWFSRKRLWWPARQYQWKSESAACTSAWSTWASR